MMSKMKSLIISRISQLTKLSSTKLSDMCPGCVRDVSEMLVAIYNSKQDSLGIGDLLENADESSKRKYRRNVLSSALKAGLIERTIPDKPTSRYQKYRLTAKARQLLNTDDERV